MRHALPVCLFALSSLLFAQSRNQDHHPVTGVIDSPFAGSYLVELTAQGRTERAQVQPDGSFRIDQVPPGAYMLRVTDLHGSLVRAVAVHVPGNGDPLQIDLSTGTPRTHGGKVSLQGLYNRPPKKAQKAFDAAQRHSEHGRHEQAILKLREAVELHPAYTEALVNLGAKLLRLNQAEEGITFLERAVATNNPSGILYGNLAAGYAMLRRDADSERAAREALRHEPTNIRAAYLLGRSILFRTGQAEEALRYLDRCRAEMPHCRLFYAEALLRTGQMDKAAAELRLYLPSASRETQAILTQKLAAIESGTLTPTGQQ